MCYSVCVSVCVCVCVCVNKKKKKKIDDAVSVTEEAAGTLKACGRRAAARSGNHDIPAVPGRRPLISLVIDRYTYHLCRSPCI